MNKMLLLTAILILAAMFYVVAPVAKAIQAIQQQAEGPKYLKYLAEGHENLKAGRRQAAIDSYKKALELDPELAVAHYFIGLVYAEQEKTDEAIGSFLKAIELDSELAEAYAALGMARIDKENYGAAAESLERALTLKPTMPGREALASAYARLGQPIKALGASKPPQLTADQLYGLGLNQFHADRNFEEAEKNFRKAVELDPNHQWAQFHLAEVYLRQEKFKEAIAAYKRAIELKVRSREVFYNLGYAYFKIDLLAESADAFHAAVKLDPKYEEAY